MPGSEAHPMIEVDAHLVAPALGLTTAEFQTLMRAGRVRTLSERGVGTDAGLYRLSLSTASGAFAASPTRPAISSRADEDHGTGDASSTGC